MSEVTDTTLIEQTATVVSAFVRHNLVRADDLPRLITDTYTALRAAGEPVEQVIEEKPAPAVSIKKSVTPDYLISLEDGRQYKALKRHLTRLGMTPDEYRQKWGLSKDYPMVAANYAAARSEMAKRSGLGRKSNSSTAIAAKSKKPTRKTRVPS